MEVYEELLIFEIDLKWPFQEVQIFGTGVLLVATSFGFIMWVGCDVTYSLKCCYQED